MTPAQTALLERALEHQTQGYRVLIIGPDKRPRHKTWGHEGKVTPGELEEAISKNGTGLAIITGDQPSGDALLVLDFDPDKKGRAQTPFDLERDFDAPFREALSKILDLDTVPCQRTPSGGLQYFLRAAEVPANIRLAFVPAWQSVRDEPVQVGIPGKPHAAIETRGKGGYTVIPTGGPERYWLNGDLASVPTVSADVLEAILSAARALDRVPKPAPKTAAPRKAQEARSNPYQGENLFEAFRADNPLEDLLERYHYTYDARAEKYLSPDSTSGNAGIIILEDKEHFLSYHADNFEDGKPHDAFDLYVEHEYKGDRDAALKAYSAQVRQARNARNTRTPTVPARKATPSEGELGGGAQPKVSGHTNTGTPEKTNATFKKALELEVAQDAAYRRGLELVVQYGCTFETSRTRYLDLDLAEQLKHDVLLLRTAMGTGKTDLMAKLLRLMGNDVSFLAVSHLVSLTKDQSSRMTIPNYKKIEGEEHLHDRAVFCVNSLWRLLKQGEVLTFDVVFIDEIEQLLRRLTSRTAFSYKRACLKVLNHLVRNAKHVILADAHLGRTTLRWLERLRKGCRPHMVLSTYRPGDGRTIRLSDDRGDVRATARDLLNRGQRGMYVVNGLKQSEDIDAWCAEEMPNVKRLLINSTTTRTDNRVQDWFTNPSEESKKYDLIIASPSASTGVSVEAGIVDFVCGEFSAGVNTPYDWMQMLARARDVKDLYVWLDTPKKTLCTDEDELLDGFFDPNGADADMVDDSEDHSGIRGINRLYGTLWIDVTVEKNGAMNQGPDLFLALALEDGFTIIEGTDAPDAKAIEQHGRAVAERNSVAAIVAAPDITKDEADLITASRQQEDVDLTRKDLDAERRYRLARFYRLPTNPTDEEVIAAYFTDQRGKLREQLKRCQLALASPDHIDRMMADERRLKEGRFQDFEWFDRQHAAYLHTLRFVGLNLATWVARKKTWDDAAILEGWVKPLERKWNRYSKTVPYWPTLERAKEHPTKALGDVLRGAFGLKQTQAGRNQKGRGYQLDRAALKAQRYWLLRRADAPEEFGAPFEKKDWGKSVKKRVQDYLSRTPMRQENTYIKTLTFTAAVSPADVPAQSSEQDRQRIDYCAVILDWAQREHLPPAELRRRAVEALVVTFDDSAREGQRERWEGYLLDARRTVSVAAAAELWLEGVALMGWAKEREARVKEQEDVVFSAPSGTWFDCAWVALKARGLNPPSRPLTSQQVAA